MPDIPPTPVTPTEPIQPTIQSPVSQTPLPQSEPEKKFISKKTILILISVIVLILVVTGITFAVLNLNKHEVTKLPPDTSSLIQPTSFPTPTQTETSIFAPSLPLSTPSPTVIPSNIFNFSKLPQAKSLDVNLNISGLSLQPTTLPNDEASDLSTLNGPNNYEIHKTGKYYEQLSPKGASMTSSNPRDLLISQLSNMGWDSQLLQNGDGFSGPQADGPCGGVWSMIGYNNGKIRFVSISFSWNPCTGDDGSQTYSKGQPIGENYKIFVSDIIDVNDLVSDLNSRP